MKEFDLIDTDINAGLSVIEASAGTGKTWTIAHLIPRMLVEGKLAKLSEAVLVTFTEDAARELSERVRRTLLDVAEAISGRQALKPGKEDDGKRRLKQLFDGLEPEARKLARLRLDNAVEESGQLQVSTIHAFCKRVLSQEAFLCGMPPGFELLTDASQMQEDALRDLWRSRLAGDPLLAAVAASQGWKLKDDLKAWQDLEPLDQPRLHPAPWPLAQAQASVIASLQALKSSRHGLEPALKGLKDGLSTNKAAQPWKLDAWAQALQALDPAAPSAALLSDLEAMTGLPKWFADRGAGKPVVAELKAGGFVRAAEDVLVALGRLQWSWTGDLVGQLRRLMEVRLRQTHATDYQGLIQQLHAALARPGRGEELAQRLRSVWRLALVDECQDTDPRQLEIFEQIFDRKDRHATELETRLILIGDPKQAIYGFRGADLRAYQAAAARAGAPAQSTLLTTYRSAPGLVTALNRLWDRLGAPLGDALLQVAQAKSALSDDELALPEDGLGSLVLAPVLHQDLAQWKRSKDRLVGAAQAAAAAIRATLGKPMGNRTVVPGDCCVLVRANHEAQAVAEALRELRIACVVRDDQDVLLSDEAGELMRILASCLKPASRSLRRGALATRLLGLDAQALGGLSEEADEAWRARLAALSEAWKRQGIAGLLAGLEAGWSDAQAPGTPQGALAQLSREPDAERRITDWRHVAELLQAQEAEHHGAPETLLHWFEAAQASAREVTAADERLRRLEQDGSAVQVLTVHRAKGLEFELVFCPYLWSVHGDPQSSEQRSVLRLANGERAYCDPSQLDAAQRAELQADLDWERLQEALRLAYVALTRAKRRVWALAGLVGYSDHSKATLPPSAMDWLLRSPDSAGRSGRDWCKALRLAKNAKEEQWPGESERASATLQSLVGLSDRISLAGLLSDAPPWTSEPVPAEALRQRRATRTQLPVWELTSFTRLSSAKDSAGPRERYDAPSSSAAASAAAQATIALDAFPKGRHAGDCLHEMLETWDFQTVEGEALRQTLRRHGLQRPVAEGVDPAVMLEQVLPLWAQAQLPAMKATLGQAAADPSLSEWAFLLPLSPQGLNGRRLAEVFAKHARDPAEAAYAQRLQALPGSVLAGFLEGFIDRLVVHGQRWGLVDWKSNHLGPLPSDYAPESLWQCAVEHHYVLQLHLYLLALRRHLLQRQDPSGPPTELVGAGLVFLRGLTPGSDRGLLWVQPSAGLLDDLDALFHLRVGK